MNVYGVHYRLNDCGHMWLSTSKPFGIEKSRVHAEYGCCFIFKYAADQVRLMLPNQSTHILPIIHCTVVRQ
jgi:hypothetical protein